MNREIKFRGFSIPQNRWLYGSLLCSETTVSGNRICEIHTPFAHALSVSFANVENESVGQFTGLKDKNGKEIYEGDVFETGFGNWQVRFGEADKTDEHFIGWFAESLSDCRQTSINSDFGGITNPYIEVIGNIYENPELFKLTA